MSIGPDIRSARRLVRRSFLRSAIVIAAIAAPTALATVANLAGWRGAAAFAWSAVAVAVAVAVLLAAQSSPEPTSLATTAAWRAAGASPYASWGPHRLTGLLLCWMGTAIGIGLGSLVGLAAARKPAGWGAVLLLGLGLALAGVAALLPVPRLHRRLSTRRRVVTDLVKFLGSLALVGAAAVTITGVGSVHTDGDAGLIVPLAATVTILVVTVALRPSLRGVLAAGRWIPALRPVLAATARHGTAGVVRMVLVAAMVVASTATVLGASVGARAEQRQDAVAALRRAPAVPPTVMAVTVPTTGSLGVVTIFGEPKVGFHPGRALSSRAVATIRRHYPDAEVTPVEWVVPSPDRRFLCGNDPRCALPLIVADPRLARAYGQPARPSDIALSFGPPVGQRLRTTHPSLSAPLAEDLVVRRAEGGPLPAATFHGLVSLEVSSDLVAELALPTDVRTVFVTSDAPFTASERSELRALVSTGELRDSHATAITADDRSGDLRDSLGQVPWAPAAGSTRWSIAAIAAAFALLVVMSTGIVDALDRRQGNYRLEQLGATPNQVRGAAALHSGLVLGMAAVLASAAVTALVAFGVERFSAARPAIAVPFVVPLPQIALLVVGVPLLGALIAAASAREGRPETHLRRDHDRRGAAGR